MQSAINKYIIVQHVEGRELTFPYFSLVGCCGEAFTRAPPALPLHCAFLTAGEVSTSGQSHTCLQLFPALWFADLKWPEAVAGV